MVVTAAMEAMEIIMVDTVVTVVMEAMEIIMVVTGDMEVS